MQGKGPRRISACTVTLITTAGELCSSARTSTMACATGARAVGGNGGRVSAPRPKYHVVPAAGVPYERFGLAGALQTLGVQSLVSLCLEQFVFGWHWAELYSPPSCENDAVGSKCLRLFPKASGSCRQRSHASASYPVVAGKPEPQ